MDRSWTDPEREPVRLAEERLERVFVGGADRVLAVAADGQTVPAVDLVNGGARRVATLPDGSSYDGGRDLRAALSPDDRRCALGLATGKLLVFDVARAEPLFAAVDVQIALPPESSSMARLEVGWDGPDVVLTSESKDSGAGLHRVHVRRDASTGRELEAIDCGRQVNHRLPTSRWRQRFAITPDGRFAVLARDGGEWVVEVVDGERHSRRRIDRGRSKGRFWLPAVP